MRAIEHLKLLKPCSYGLGWFKEQTLKQAWRSNQGNFLWWLVGKLIYRKGTDLNREYCTHPLNFHNARGSPSNFLDERQLAQFVRKNYTMKEILENLHQVKNCD